MMRMGIAALVLFAGVSAAKVATVPLPSDEIKVFVLAGQVSAAALPGVTRASHPHLAYIPVDEPDV